MGQLIDSMLTGERLFAVSADSVVSDSLLDSIKADMPLSPDHEIAINPQVSSLIFILYVNNIM